MAYARYGKEYFSGYGELFKTAAVYGLKRGVVVGGITSTLLALLFPETREHLLALYAGVIPAVTVGSITGELLFSPLENRVIQHTNGNQGR